MTGQGGQEGGCESCLGGNVQRPGGGVDRTVLPVVGTWEEEQVGGDGEFAFRPPILGLWARQLGAAGPCSQEGRRVSTAKIQTVALWMNF